MNIHTILFIGVGILLIIYCIYVLLMLTYEIIKKYKKRKLIQGDLQIRDDL